MGFTIPINFVIFYTGTIFMLFTVQVSMVASNSTLLLNSTAFHAHLHCKGPIVWSCEACGLPIYQGGNAKVAGQCISAIVREKNLASERRKENGRFSFDSTTTPLNDWIHFDGFEIRLLQFIARKFLFYVALYDWQEWQETALNSSHLLNITKDDPNLAKRSILALVSDDHFDMGIGSFTATIPPPDMLVLYSDGFLSMSVVLVQRLPPSSKEVHTIPFSPIVLLVAFFILIAHSILWSLARNAVSRNHHQYSVFRTNKKVVNKTYWIWLQQWSFSFQEIFSTIFNQDIRKANYGTNISPAGWLGLGIWWLYAIIFTAVYTATMTSKMSVTYGDAVPVNGLDDLASRNGLIPIVKRDSVISAWLEERKEQPIYKEIWDKLMANPLMFTDLPQDGIFKLLRDEATGERVLLTSTKASFVYGKDLICESQVEPVNYHFWKAFPVAPNNTQLRRKLSEGIRIAMATAILNKLTRDFSVEITPLCQKGGTEFGLAGISIVNLDTSFLYLGYALFICTVIALTERIGSHFLSRRTVC